MRDKANVMILDLVLDYQGLMVICHENWAYGRTWFNSAKSYVIQSTQLEVEGDQVARVQSRERERERG